MSNDQNLNIIIISFKPVLGSECTKMKQPMKSGLVKVFSNNYRFITFTPLHLPEKLN